MTEATKLQKMERRNKLQIKPLLASKLQQGERKEGKLNCCGRCLHDGVEERKDNRS